MQIAINIALILTFVVSGFFTLPRYMSYATRVPMSIKEILTSVFSFALMVACAITLVLFNLYAAPHVEEGATLGVHTLEETGVALGAIIIASSIALIVLGYKATVYTDRAYKRWYAPVVWGIIFTTCTVNVGLVTAMRDYLGSTEERSEEVSTVDLYAVQNGEVTTSEINGSFSGFFLTGTYGTISGKTEQMDVIAYQYGTDDGGIKIGTVPRGEKYTTLYYDATIETARLDIITECVTKAPTHTAFEGVDGYTSCNDFDPLEKRYEFHLPAGMEEFTWEVFSDQS